MKESIKEQTIKPEDCEIGGNAFQILVPEQIGSKFKFLVKSFDIAATEWGNRIDFLVQNDFAEYKISSWNLISEKKFKAAALVGKMLLLDTVKQGDKLKFKILEID